MDPILWGVVFGFAGLLVAGVTIDRTIGFRRRVLTQLDAYRAHVKLVENRLNLLATSVDKYFWTVDEVPACEEVRDLVDMYEGWYHGPEIIEVPIDKYTVPHNVKFTPKKKPAQRRAKK